MKTKIIYISGSEIFDMADIRGAFNQVRAALALDDDTVLFGVPVDRADALDVPAADTFNITPMAMSDENVADSEVVAETIIENTTDSIATDIIPDSAPAITVTPIVTDAISEPVEQPTDAEVIPVKKSRGRPKSVKKIVADEPAVTESVPDAGTDEQPAQDTEHAAKVISILSVLTSKSDDAADTDVAPAETEPVVEPVAMSVIEPVDQTDATPTDIDLGGIVDTLTVETVVEEPESPAEPEQITQPVDAESETIQNIITDEMPSEPMEKTLEQLLESMTPLREDHEHMPTDDTFDTVEEPVSDVDADDSVIDVADTTDTDATLEQLATEFAEKQDKITIAPKAENHGKIGKLKNILPFKKARRDDSGLMGDLFGWAGIAANDEEFSIPGFFANAASKK